MNKKVRNTIIATVIGVSLFGSGALIEANSSWLDGIIQSSKREIGTAGMNKKNDLLAGVDKVVEARTKEKLSATVQEKKAKVEAELEAHFKQKLEEIDTSDAFKTLESELDEHVEFIINAYKDEIDKAISGK
jgi:hypothetical protein